MKGMRRLMMAAGLSLVLIFASQIQSVRGVTQKVSGPAGLNCRVDKAVDLDNFTSFALQGSKETADSLLSSWASLPAGKYVFLTASGKPLAEGTASQATAVYQPDCRLAQSVKVDLTSAAGFARDVVSESGLSVAEGKTFSASEIAWLYQQPGVAVRLPDVVLFGVPYIEVLSGDGARTGLMMAPTHEFLVGGFDSGITVTPNVELLVTFGETTRHLVLTKYGANPEPALLDITALAVR